MAQQKKCRCKDDGGHGGGGGGHDGAGGLRWLLTYADMITLLLGLFIILYALKVDNPSKIIDFARGLNIALGVETPSAEDGKGGEGGRTPVPIPPSVEVPALVDKISTITDTSGSPITPRINERGVLITLAADTYFQPNSANLSNDARNVLRSLGDILNQGPVIKRKVSIYGHTDSDAAQPPFEDNMQLSYARGKAVYDVFRYDNQLEQNRLSVTSYGEAQPHNNLQSSNNTPEGKEKNRRIEILIEHLPVEQIQFSQVNQPGISALSN